MHLFRLNNHGDGDGDKAIWASPVFLSWFLPFYYTSATVCIVCSFLLLFDPISSLHAQRSLIPIWKSHSLPQLCPKLLPLLALLPSKTFSFVHPGKPRFFQPPCRTSGTTVQEGWCCSSSSAPRQVGTGGRALLSHCIFREPRKNLAAGLKVPSLCWVRLEFSQNQVVIFCRGRKGHVLHTWTQPLKFHLFTAEHKDTRILWRTVMRGLSKQTNGVCLHKPVLKNFLLLMLSKTVSWSTVVLQHF